MIQSSPLGRAEFKVPRRRLSERLRALGIQDARAPTQIPVHRQEIYDAIQREKARDGENDAATDSK